MNTYEIEIDYGQGGRKTIEAASDTEAWKKAVAWAEAGDWPQGGCTVLLNVRREGDEIAAISRHIEVGKGE